MTANITKTKMKKMARVQVFEKLRDLLGERRDSNNIFELMSEEKIASTYNVDAIEKAMQKIDKHIDTIETVKCIYKHAGAREKRDSNMTWGITETGDISLIHYSRDSNLKMLDVDVDEYIEADTDERLTMMIRALKRHKKKLQKQIDFLREEVEVDIAEEETETEEVVEEVAEEKKETAIEKEIREAIEALQTAKEMKLEKQINEYEDLIDGLEKTKHFQDQGYKVLRDFDRDDYNIAKMKDYSDRVEAGAIKAVKNFCETENIELDKIYIAEERDDDDPFCYYEYSSRVVVVIAEY